MGDVEGLVAPRLESGRTIPSPSREIRPLSHPGRSWGPVRSHCLLRSEPAARESNVKHRRVSLDAPRLNAHDWSKRTFASLENPNYRRFFIGQSVSVIGTWMQSVAQSWLVLELSRFATMIGLVVAVQTLPVLRLAPYGGLMADRLDKTAGTALTQSTLALFALVLGVLVLSNEVRLWMVFTLATALGTVNSIDNPTRQAFIAEMVGSDSVSNAVSLNSVMSNGARAIRPAIAGVFIETVGVGGWCDRRTVLPVGRPLEHDARAVARGHERHEPRHLAPGHLSGPRRQSARGGATMAMPQPLSTGPSPLLREMALGKS